ncbi:M23 family metallopeptidase [Helicobacter anatolicus]|uniref:M23 family metallopeptidase n=1 Tax=Helicobacter anatolicus TaxID=2905874 RepID=UPI001E64D7E9|nr:M23 family metallopeptidase [Helicobacter anatolicus]MCE3038450.1 M23 family metallopeptidase [Helicobacter anatolicus]
MKNKRLVFMITDHKGSFYFNVSMLVRQISLYILLAIFALIIFIVVSIGVVRTEIKDINNKKNILNQEFRKTIKINTTLNNEITQRMEEINIAGDRVDDLEDIIGVSKSEDAIIESSLLSRIDIANITGAQRAFIMKFIPNGFPLDKYLRISAGFGTRMHPILHILHKHTGVDFSTSLNTPVYATADGVVEFAGMGWNGGYGNLVKITHSFGFKTYYAHLNSIVARNGQFVKKGQIIAYSGNTGVSTGPHLHYEVRFLNNPINALNFAKWNMKNFDFIFDNERIVAWQSLLALINNLMLPSRVVQQQ